MARIKRNIGLNPTRQQMSFSSFYFSRYNITQSDLFPEKPQPGVGIIVVIPCYNDPLIFKTLQSLEQTAVSEQQVEVIVVVNSGIETPQHIATINREIFDTLEYQANTSCYKRFKLLPLIIENIPKKTAGVGNARKTGMDEAVRRFTTLNAPDGIIISLDADTIVDKTYFQQIESNFKKYPEKGAFTIQFKHNLNAEEFPANEIEACKLYEIYLRYFRLSLKATGFPYSFHTIGSAFAVKASCYTKAGGMPRKQGGEDFYFLHKLALMTTIGEVPETLVYPAPRISDRVPFGTGPAINRILKHGEYKVYNFRLFLLLKQFYNQLYAIADTRKAAINLFPTEIVNITGQEKLSGIISECLKHTKTTQALSKRLFSKFDAFFIIKLFHELEKSGNYPSIHVTEAAKTMLEYYHVNPTNDLYNDVLLLDKSSC